ncbi:MAG: DNA-protecting protein DprA [Thermoplasmata archaeon]|nr:DNA-protecting protein DprA [Thermoplasmata archaeon]
MMRPEGRTVRSTRAEASPEELIGPLTEVERKFAPKHIYMEGTAKLPLVHPRVSIVGTRTPSSAGRQLAGEIASGLAQRGVIVVSGLARGVDTAVHSAVIASGGFTIAVLGTPLSRVYPAENKALQEEISRDHLVVSQFQEGASVQPSNFVIRNRTMALISDASVIVESGETGGSLSQGWETLRLGHPLFIHDREFSKALRWPSKMAEYGAIRFRDADDILDFLPTDSPRPDLAILALEST